MYNSLSHDQGNRPSRPHPDFANSTTSRDERETPPYKIKDRFASILSNLPLSESQELRQESKTNLGICPSLDQRLQNKDVVEVNVKLDRVLSELKREKGSSTASN